MKSGLQSFNSFVLFFKNNYRLVFKKEEYTYDEEEMKNSLVS